jgi:hypothetical protein
MATFAPALAQYGIHARQDFHIAKSCTPDHELTAAGLLNADELRGDTLDNYSFADAAYTLAKVGLQILSLTAKGDSKTCKNSDTPGTPPHIFYGRRHSKPTSSDTDLPRTPSPRLYPRKIIQHQNQNYTADIDSKQIQRMPQLRRCKENSTNLAAYFDSKDGKNVQGTEMCTPDKDEHPGSLCF